MSRGVKQSRIKSGFLSILIHVVLFLFLVVSLDWNHRDPEPVMVELWSPETKPQNVQPAVELKPAGMEMPAPEASATPDDAVVTEEQ